AEPWASPVLALALSISGDVAAGRLDLAGLEDVVQLLTLVAFARRAERARAYLGDLDPARAAERAAALVLSLARDERGALRPAEDFAAAIATPRFGIVLTAHPTFSIGRDLSRTLAELAAESDLSGAPLDEAGRAERLARAARTLHRPPASLTLDAEHQWSL